MKRINNTFKMITVYLLSTVFANAQAPESCDCIVDTSGLNSYMSTLTMNENQPLSFEVPDQNATFAVLHGYINGSTPNAATTFINNYPNVTTLVFGAMPGSDDDDANLEAAQILRNKGFKHFLPSVNHFSQDCFIASGAVDMFLGGLIRVVEPDGEVGVHSWSDGTNDATAFPVGHAYHQPYINYYIAMGFTQQESEDFYYYTINAAPAASIYLMPEADIDHYKVRSCVFMETPNYIIQQENGMLFTDLSNSTYQWVDCDNSNEAIVGATSSSFTPNDEGNYAVEITEQGCSGTSNCLNNMSATLVSMPLSNIEIFPNPGKKVVYVKNSSTQEIELTIRDNTGGMVYPQQNLAPNAVLKLSQLAPGIYYISSYSEDTSFKTKVIIMD